MEKSRRLVMLLAVRSGSGAEQEDGPRPRGPHPGTAPLPGRRGGLGR